MASPSLPRRNVNAWSKTWAYRGYLSLPAAQRLTDSLSKATVVAGFFSIVTSSGLLLYVLYRVFRMCRTRKPLYPITFFYISLLFWGIIQGIGWVINIRWIQLDVAKGGYCVTQAVIMQLGTSGTALSIIGMSWCIFHDYVADSAENVSLRHGYIGLAMISLIQALNIAIPNAIRHGAGHYYGISTYWCLIAKGQSITKIFTHYIWCLLGVLFSFLTALAYSFSTHYRRRLPAGFLWIGFPIKGNKLFRIGLFSVTFRDRRAPDWSWSMDIKTPTRTFTFMLPLPIQYFDQNEDEVDPDEVPEVDKHYANKLIWFPITYLMAIIPQSIVRFMQVQNQPVSDPAIFSAATILALTGVVDAILFLVVQPVFGLAEEGLETMGSQNCLLSFNEHSDLPRLK